MPWIALGADLIGEEFLKKYGTWPMYAKFFDNELPLFHHLHLDFDAAARIGWQENRKLIISRDSTITIRRFPVTYFGFDPDCTKERGQERLLQYQSGDNRITELSELTASSWAPAGTPPGWCTPRVPI